MDDLFGLEDDKWWERLLGVWERVPGRVRTALVAGLMSLAIFGLLVMVNAWTQLRVG